MCGTSNVLPGFPCFSFLVLSRIQNQIDTAHEIEESLDADDFGNVDFGEHI